MNRYKQTVILYFTGALSLGIGFAFRIDQMFWGGVVLLLLPMIARMWNEHQHDNPNRPDPTVGPTDNLK